MPGWPSLQLGIRAEKSLSETLTLDGLPVGLKRQKDLGIIYNREVKVEIGLKRQKDLGIVYNHEVKVKIGLKRQKDLGIIYNRSYLKVK